MTSHRKFTVSQHLLQQTVHGCYHQASPEAFLTPGWLCTHTCYSAQPRSYTPESVLVNPKRHSLIYTQPISTKDLNWIPQNSLRSPKNCLTQIFLGNLGSSELKQAGISLTSDWNLVPQSSPLITGGDCIVSAAIRAIAIPLHYSSFSHLCSKAKIPCWVPYFKATNIIQ